MAEIYFDGKQEGGGRRPGGDQGGEGAKEMEEKKQEDNENGRLKPENEERKNKFENYDLAEGHEKAMNDRLDEQDSGQMIAYKNGIEYDMSCRKREVRMKKEDKAEMEKMRRWHVKIYNIYITPLMKMIDPFVQFTVGGDFCVNVYKNKKGDTYKVPNGERGYTDKTEVLEHVDIPQDDEGKPGGRTPFSKIIDIEMRMSYSMVNKQKLMIELWDHNFPWMNTIVAYITIPLIDIVNGDFNVGEYLTKKEGKRKNPQPQAFIEFSCIFQEIWDFNLHFLNWKATNIMDPKLKPGQDSNRPDTKVKVEILDYLGKALNTVTVSEVCKNSATPTWTNFDRKIVFRGTIADLENTTAKISLIKSGTIFDDVLCSRTVGFRGLVDFEKLKSEMALKTQDGGDTFPCTVQGFVTLDHKPRYKQRGQNIVLLSTKKYLVIKIMRVEHIRPAETRGIVDSFVSVEWSGMNQRTRTVVENNNPTFNEYLFFPVQLKDEWLQDIPKYILKINEELRSKNEVIFNLMIEGDDNTYDNFGIGFFYLSEIKGGEKQQEKYFAEDLKEERHYLSEKYTGKVKLISAFSHSKQTYLHFEAWFLENFPPEVDFGEKKKKSEMRDKIPTELKPHFPNGVDKTFKKAFDLNISKKFRKYTNYPYKERMFGNTSPQDQYENHHLLPYFLSQITLPEKRYTKQDVQNDPNFFDCNLTTLDEIAHYVRCFTFPSELKPEIWSSPDFMTKRRKGNVEDHSLLMASLMIGLKKTKYPRKPIMPLDEAGESIQTKSSPGRKNHTSNTGTGTTSQTGKETNNLLDSQSQSEKDKLINTNATNTTGKDMIDSKDIKMEEALNPLYLEDSYPYENRVFVCQGKLKDTKQQYTWVMSIGDDYQTVTMWDPKLDQKFVLKGRVKDPTRLMNFLNHQYPSYGFVEQGLTQNYVKPKEEPKPNKGKKIDEEIELKGEGPDASLLRYQAEEDFNDGIANDSMHSENEKIAKNMIDEKIAYQSGDNIKGVKKGYDFVEDDKTIEKELDKGDEKNFLPVDNFRDQSGNICPEVIMPYETLDLIFNRNNIYANCQCHNPAQIRYDIYDRSRWLPYIVLEGGKIFKGEFECFYPISNFIPVFSPSLVRKMNDSLTREMRRGIAAARSGKNLPTKFKKKKEKINKQLAKYLDCLEYRSLNRMSEEEFKDKKRSWEIICKKYMPKFYRMVALTVFFNFYELEIIRREITEDLEDFWYDKTKNLMFATATRIYAYPNQAVSVRIMLAKFFRIPEEDITDPTEEKEYKEMLNEDPEKLVEEEVSSDEENDKKEQEKNGVTKGQRNSTIGRPSGTGRPSGMGERQSRTGGTRPSASAHGRPSTLGEPVVI